jgi:heme oxygenase
MRMDKNGQEWMGRHGKGIGREWREITIKLSKLPQNQQERRTRFPGTKYFYPTLHEAVPVSK